MRLPYLEEPHFYYFRKKEFIGGYGANHMLPQATLLYSAVTQGLSIFVLKTR